MENADGALLEALIAGRVDAFEELYERFAPRLLRAAHCITRRKEDAEDAVQDVFIALVRTGPALREVKNLNAYLFTSVHRSACRRAQQRSEHEQIDAESIAAPHEGDAEGAHSERLSRALQSLPLEQRTVLSLKIDGEMTFEQIAEMLNVSVNTAASRYRYALEKLRSALAPAAKAPTGGTHG
ncbi:MAG TPA: sigma-70 family RNA polymerase sigma factor [Planctomycetota bacterium]|nr:sigma-70 family RNA polymerase sigma factor [Planctomycetota bacterium]